VNDVIRAEEIAPDMMPRIFDLFVQGKAPAPRG
jgi:hypothetical protein